MDDRFRGNGARAQALEIFEAPAVDGDPCGLESVRPGVRPREAGVTLVSATICSCGRGDYRLQSMSCAGSRSSIL